MSTTERANSSYLALATLRGVPYLDPEEAIAMTALTPLGWATLPEVTEDELGLAVAMLNVEVALRRTEQATCRVDELTSVESNAQRAPFNR